MTYEIWDVVQVPAFPNQENSKFTTSRPCIIIENLNDKVVICPITKQVNQAYRYKYCFIIACDSKDGKAMGLTFDSLIILDREAVFNNYRIHKKIGYCLPSVVDKIEELLKLKDSER